MRFMLSCLQIVGKLGILEFEIESYWPKQLMWGRSVDLLVGNLAVAVGRCFLFSQFLTFAPTSHFARPTFQFRSPSSSLSLAFAVI